MRRASTPARRLATNIQSQLTVIRGLWQCPRPARTTHLRTPCSLAELLKPSPGHALPPHQPISRPTSSPRARNPPAPPAVLMRPRLCAAQGGVRRGFGVWQRSWRLQIPSHRAAHACLCRFACTRVVSVLFARARAMPLRMPSGKKSSLHGRVGARTLELGCVLWCSSTSQTSLMRVVSMVCYETVVHGTE